MKSITLVSAVSAAADITSIAFDLGDYKDFSLSAQFSDASLNGTLTLLSCNVDTTADYGTVADSSKAIASGVAHTYNVTKYLPRYVKVKYAATSGTGTMTATLVVKDTVNKGG